MRCDTIILAAPQSDQPPHWLRVVDGRVVQRGTGTRWGQGEEDGTADGRVLLVLPPHVTTLHWIVCPQMTVRQGAVAARIMALESSIGATDQLHAAVLPGETPDAPHIVAVTSHSAMTHWLDWCAEHDVSQARFIPAALLLPAPSIGFVRGRIGACDVVRGVDCAFDGAEPSSALILGDGPSMLLSPEAVEAALLEALDDPPLDLRQGAFAPPTERLFDRARLTRMAVVVGLILLSALAVSLVRIARLNLEASRLDAETVALARSVDPSIGDAAEAEVKLTARLAAHGGEGGFTAVMAGLMSAMRANPAVSLTSASQMADGSLRVQLAATKTQDINDVLVALQEAGWRISANAVQQRGGRLVADIMVVR